MLSGENRGRNENCGCGERGRTRFCVLLVGYEYVGWDRKDCNRNKSYRETVLIGNMGGVRWETLDDIRCFHRNVIKIQLTYLLSYLLTHTLTQLLTHSLTPCSKVLLEKLTGSQLVKKFPAFYGTRRFITAFTSTRELSLSWASSIQSTPPIPLPEDPS